MYLHNEMEINEFNFLIFLTKSFLFYYLKNLCLNRIQFADLKLGTNFFFQI